MNNSRSIFTRYFAICTGIILLSFFCLGTVLMLVSSRYFLDEKKSLMLKNAKALALFTQEKMEEDPSDWRETAGAELKKYAIGSNADYMLCSEDGYIIISSEELRDYLTVSPSLLTSFSESGGYIYSDLGGAMSEENHVTGLAFTANGPRYYMLAYAEKSEQDNYSHTIMEIFVTSALLVMLIVLFLVYFATLKLTTPITEVAQIAKRLGSGDFSVTVPEYSTREFNQLGAAFNEMAANLKSYDTMRNSFLANVSHELRTPMTSIGGFVDGILDGTIPKAKERYYLGLISSEIKRLTRLVRSMLNLAKIEAGELDPTYVDFSVLEPIVETLLTFEPRIDEKHIDIQGLDVDRVMISADIDLIHQVIYNLIENSIKFVDEGGYIRFSFSKQEGYTAISIRNSGEGLDEAELPLVFDRFYKVDKSRGIHAKGLGLGLNIVRSIVELHGGTITVTSEKGEYTEFTFTIPDEHARPSADGSDE